MTDIEKEMGKHLKQLRVELKMTQQEFATAIGCTQMEVCFWETGRRLVPIKYLLRICDEFKIDFVFFDIRR